MLSFPVTLDSEHNTERFMNFKSRNHDMKINSEIILQV